MYFINLQHYDCDIDFFNKSVVANTSDDIGVSLFIYDNYFYSNTAVVSYFQDVNIRFTSTSDENVAIFFDETSLDIQSYKDLLFANTTVDIVEVNDDYSDVEFMEETYKNLKKIEQQYEDIVSIPVTETLDDSSYQIIEVHKLFKNIFRICWNDPYIDWIYWHLDWVTDDIWEVYCCCKYLKFFGGDAVSFARDKYFLVLLKMTWVFIYFSVKYVICGALLFDDYYFSDDFLAVHLDMFVHTRIYEQQQLRFYYHVDVVEFDVCIISLQNLYLPYLGDYRKIKYYRDICGKKKQQYNLADFLTTKFVIAGPTVSTMCYPDYIIWSDSSKALLFEEFDSLISQKDSTLYLQPAEEIKSDGEDL